MKEPMERNHQWLGHRNAWHHAENEKIPLEQLEPETTMPIFHLGMGIAFVVEALIWAGVVWFVMWLAKATS